MLCSIVCVLSLLRTYFVSCLPSQVEIENKTVFVYYFYFYYYYYYYYYYYCYHYYYYYYYYRSSNEEPSVSAVVRPSPPLKSHWFTCCPVF